MKTDKKIIAYSQLQPLSNKMKKDGKTIILTTGCFDILHLGHVVHFNFCKTKGDVLVVSVGNDKTVKKLKGPKRPINDEKFRARMVAALECVDYVVISRESGIMDHTKIVELLKPDVYVVPQTDSMLEEKKRLVLKHKGKVVTCRRQPPGNMKGGISTTLIEGKLVEEK